MSEHVECVAREFKDAVADVLLHAGKEDSRLACVRVEFNGAGRVILSASDGYTAARVWVGCAFDTNPGPWVTCVDCRAFRDAAKAVCGSGSMFVRLDCAGGVLVLSCAQLGTTTTLAHYGSPAALDNVGAMLDEEAARVEAGEPVSVPRVAFYPKYLERLPKTKSHDEKTAPVVLYPSGERSRCYVRVGERFEALIMPTRLSD